MTTLTPDAQTQVNPSAQFSTLIFDFDGTLADSLMIHLQIYNQLAEKYGRPPIDFKEVDKLRNLSMKKFLQYIGLPIWRVPQYLPEALKLKEEQHLEPDIFPGISDAITTLATRYQLGILTSNTVENVERFLTHHNIRSAFAWVYAEKDLFGKQHKLKKLLRQYELSAQAVCYVGDEVRDVESAHQAGLEVVAVDWGFNSTEALTAAQPLAVAHQPAELLTIFDK